MAIDTRNKRASAGSLMGLETLPSPGSTADAIYRAQIAGLYAADVNVVVTASIVAAVCSQLKNNAGVSAIVGDEVFRDVAPPEATEPYITVTKLGSDHVKHQEAAAGIVAVRLQVSSWDDNPEDAETLADKVRLAMDGKVGGEIGTAPNNVAVKSVFLEEDSGTYTAPREGSSVGVYGVAQDWMIWHSETVPTF